MCHVTAAAITINTPRSHHASTAKNADNKIVAHNNVTETILALSVIALCSL